jgi:hypothetical protein
MLRCRQKGGQIDRCGGLSYAALLIGNGDYAGQFFPQLCDACGIYQKQLVAAIFLMSALDFVPRETNLLKSINQRPVLTE